MKKNIVLPLIFIAVCSVISCVNEQPSSAEKSYNITPTGECIDSEDFFITPHDVTYDCGILQVLDYKGAVKKEIRLPAYAYSFKKYQYADNTIRYAYMQVLCASKYPGGVYEDTKLVLLDENFQTVNDNIRLLKSDIVPEADWPLENHDYEVLGDNHFILMTVVPATVTNIPGYTGEGYNVYNSVIQEQKDGEVVWEFQSIDYPELYPLTHTYSNTAWDWNDETYQKGSGNYNDYIHFNALSYDSQNDAFVLSYRGLGIIKVDRKTKKILWALSSMQQSGVENDLNVDVSDFSDVDVYGHFQHDVNVLSDGSMTVFDNHIVGDVRDVQGNGKSRIIRFNIDDSTKKMTSFTEYVCNSRYSPFMGSAKLLDEDSQTYLIAYGGYISDPAFEVYSFRDKKQIMKIVYEEGHDLYNVGHGTENALVLSE